MIMEKDMGKEGYITVYLSLSLLVMLSLIFTLIEGIRMQTIRFQTECVMDIGLNSIFAEYHRELLNQYGMFAIDTTYGYESADEKRTESHLIQYMNINFSAPGKDRIPDYKDLTAIQADNTKFSKVSYLSDGNGTVLKYQIVQYMKEKSGLSVVDSYIPDDFSGTEGEYHELESKRESSNSIIDEILQELNNARAEGESEISIHNPADQVDAMRGTSLLTYAVKNSGDISCRQVDVSSYISHRDYREGYGLWEEQKRPDGMLDKTLFQQYLFEKCGYYQEKKEQGALQYQLEYLLYGKGSDIKNLDAFASQVFAIRYVINAAHLFSSASKLTEASELAATVTATIASPQLYEAVKTTILFAWCYAESVQDLRIIFDGKAVATVKNDVTWNTPLSELLTFTSSLDTYKEASGGKTYKDYLQGFLFMKDEKTVRMRLMDIMEMDIRETTGNENFKMDACIYQLEAEVNVSSKYGYGYSICRDFSYE